MITLYLAVNVEEAVDVEQAVDVDEVVDVEGVMGHIDPHHQVVIHHTEDVPDTIGIKRASTRVISGCSTLEPVDKTKWVNGNQIHTATSIQKHQNQQYILLTILQLWTSLLNTLQMKCGTY